MLIAPLAIVSLSFASSMPAAHPGPEIVETRTVKLTQTVTIQDIPEGAREVQAWVPVPGDAAWQRVLDRHVESAPGDWKVVEMKQGTFIHVTLTNPKMSETAIVVSSVVEREGVRVDLNALPSGGEINKEFFAKDLDRNAPLMNVDARIQSLADAACGTETDVAQQVMMLIDAVASGADHYSINSEVPTCGRGAASDCIKNGGGCCTDLHSLFIAMARARGIPARMQYGYRLLDGREGKAYDPGYRCWVEFFIPGSGWLTTDIVAADNAKQSAHNWVTLSSTRIWLWSGRSFTLEPANAAGPVDTMISGWVEIDGVPIDPLPAADGTPSRVGRTLMYEVLSNTRNDKTPALPQ
jgi:transglutaminase-like putative cysteine protease